MPIHYKNNLAYYTFPVLDNFGIIHGFFMRHGGCSPKPWESLNMATSVGDSRENVIENRRRVMECLHLNAKNIFDVWQVHSNKVIYSNKPRKIGTSHQKADAIYTDKKNVILMMLFADCVPVILYDPDKEVGAIVHAGWMGTVNNIIGETLDMMQNQLNCIAKSIIACIGPSISVHQYEVGENVIDEVKVAFVKSKDVLIIKNQKYYFNLQKANEINLRKKGVREIFHSKICTAGNTEDWFSHRGENGMTGRFAN